MTKPVKITNLIRAKELGITDRTLREYQKREGWPSDGIFKDQVIWIINNGKDGYADVGNDTEEMVELRKKKLQAEIDHKHTLTAKGREKILGEFREQLREEALEFLGGFVDTINSLKLDEETNERLKRAIADAYENIQGVD